MRWILLTALLLVGGAPATTWAQGMPPTGSPPAKGVRPTSGIVTDVNMTLRTIQLGDETYTVMEGATDFDRVTTGVYVTLHFKEELGKARVSAVEFEDAQ